MIEIAISVVVSVVLMYIIYYFTLQPPPPPPPIVPTNVPVGTIVSYAGGKVPAGWILCDNAAYPPTTYPALYAAIGYTYGMGGMNYRVPDTRGVFLRGTDPSGLRDTTRSVGTIQLSTTTTPTVDFYHVISGADQTINAVPYAIQYAPSKNTPAVSSGSAVSQISPATFLLKAGRTYKCMAGTGAVWISYGIVYSFYNVTTSAPFGNTAWIYSNHPWPDNGTLLAYITPTVDTTISVVAVTGKDAIIFGSASTNTGNKFGDSNWQGGAWVSIEAMSNNSSVIPFAGATATTPGFAGYIPAPPVGAQTQYLRGDGTWAAPPATVIQQTGTRPALDPARKVAVGGVVFGVCVVNGGSGYTSPVIKIASPPVTSGGTYLGQLTSTATAVATIFNGAITAVTVTDGGWGYTQQSLSMVNGSYTYVGYTVTDPTGAGSGAVLIVYNVVSGLETEMNVGAGHGGDQSICYIMADGTLSVCGHNNWGHISIGDGGWTNLPRTASWYETPLAPQLYNDPIHYYSNTYATTPQIVVRVYASHINTYVLTASGYLYSTGSGEQGQLGLGDVLAGTRGTFMRITGVANVVKFVCTEGIDHTVTCIALTAAGTAYGWGYNGFGQLGQGHTNKVTSPVQLYANINTAITLVTDIAAFGHHGHSWVYLTCNTNGVKGCCLSAGRNNYGQLCQNHRTDTNNGGFNYALFADRTIISDVSYVVGGGGEYGTTIMRRNSGEVLTCGRGSNGQIGNGNNVDNQTTAAGLSQQNGFKQNAAKVYCSGNTWGGGSTSLCMAIDTNGSLVGWGQNSRGELGLLSNKMLSAASNPAWVNIPTYSWIADGPKSTSATTGVVSAVYGPVKKVTMHSQSDRGGTCILTEDGRLYYAGSNDNHCAGVIPGQGGNGWFVRVIFNRTDIVDVKFCGGYTVSNLVVLCSTGEVFACGYNNLGQLGNGQAGALNGCPDRTYQLSKVRF